eukprot:CAMPEP_0177694180 /NCGR_PEP_ID=MMETSP0484_2-20121128/2799_1 /TAXON_ID=354590 /ORGANISM="Rhodomonas lens, Strain RHODO" /LENGTH=179 /DNA_ID=CAMNT_0019205047 /DNA_START=472 /DNA_END=1011 /DNA_ORIENTATION=+
MVVPDVEQNPAFSGHGEIYSFSAIDEFQARHQKAVPWYSWLGIWDYSALRLFPSKESLLQIASPHCRIRVLEDARAESAEDRKADSFLFSSLGWDAIWDVHERVRVFDQLSWREGTGSMERREGIHAQKRHRVLEDSDAKRVFPLFTPEESDACLSKKDLIHISTDVQQLFVLHVGLES